MELVTREEGRGGGGAELGGVCWSCRGCGCGGCLRGFGVVFSQACRAEGSTGQLAWAAVGLVWFEGVDCVGG